MDLESDDTVEDEEDVGSERMTSALALKRVISCPKPQSISEACSVRRLMKQRMKPDQMETKPQMKKQIQLQLESKKIFMVGLSNFHQMFLLFDIFGGGHFD